MIGLNKKQSKKLLEHAKHGIDNRVTAMLHEEFLTIKGTTIVESGQKFDSIEQAIANIILNQNGQTTYTISIVGDNINFCIRKG